MGTVLQLTVSAANREIAERLVDESFDVARHWDAVLTTWRPDGELAILNASAGQGPIPISNDLATSLRKMATLAAATGGAFQPAIGPFVELLRHGSPTADLNPGSPRFRIAEAVEVGLDGRARLLAGARLDSGAIGKGIALDAIAAELRRAGARSAFLDFGGSSQLAFGKPEGSNRWSMLVAGLRPGTVHGVIELEQRSLSTSRALGAHDAAGAIVDPRSGMPVSPARLATVLADDATTAEAWSTALIVLGAAGLPMAQAAGVEALVEDSTGTSHTAGFILRPVSPD